MENIEKIYGEYPGNLRNLEEIENYSEIELFLAISTLENLILEYKRVMAFIANKGFELEEDEYALQYLINKTSKFGVELEKDEKGKILRTGDYVSWYEFHVNFFGRTLNMRDYKKYLELKHLGYNLSKYLPNDSYLLYKKRKQQEQDDINSAIQKIKKSNIAS